TPSQPSEASIVPVASSARLNAPPVCALRAGPARSVGVTQNRTAPSSQAETSTLPGPKLRAFTCPDWHCQLATGRPVSASQRLTLSNTPVAISLPSRLYARSELVPLSF